jgi:formylglycine-generating enzyme required for sulfatase activity
MGCNERVDDECVDGEKPGRRVQVRAFAIDRTEVTVEAYEACVWGGGCSEPNTGDSCNWEVSGRERHPINCVDWEQAKAYCAWAGKRLPTEAEWEKAARGEDGRKYPWGNLGFARAGKVANIADETARAQDSKIPWALEGYRDGYYDTAPVGSYPEGASPYGAQDMIGNVWEWLEDESERGRAVRGGSWLCGPAYARASKRYWDGPAFRLLDFGFRCAQSF